MITREALKAVHSESAVRKDNLSISVLKPQTFSIIKLKVAIRYVNDVLNPTEKEERQKP